MSEEREARTWIITGAGLALAEGPPGDVTHRIVYGR
jgi:hypothetical protein